MEQSFATWLHATALSQAINYYPWLWPICESLHFIGLALLVGITGTLDLRLLGFMKSVSISAIRDFMPWAIVGFAINLVTGLVFFIGLPRQYVDNVAFYGKMFFLLVAGLNAMFFETRLGSRVLTLGPGEDTPTSFKIVGALSLFSWLAVLYFGRMLPFIGNSF